MRHRSRNVADVEQADLALVDGRERVRDERIEAGLVDLHVEDAAAAGRHGHGLHAVERIVRAHVSERVYPGLVWMALHFTEQKVNWLTHDVGDPLIGTPEYKVSAVRLEPLHATGAAGD